jgi:hypothetical protein
MRQVAMGKKTKHNRWRATIHGRPDVDNLAPNSFACTIPLCTKQRSMKSIKGGFWPKDDKGKKNNKSNLVLPLLDGVQNYPEILMELIQPHVANADSFDDYQAIIELAIIAWNMGVIGTLGFPGHKEMVETTLADAGIRGKDKKLVYELIQQKMKKYPADNDMIQEFEMEEDGISGFNLKLMTQPLHNFLASTNFEDDFEEDDQFVDGYADRSAIGVVAKAAFWEWVRQHDKTFTDADVLTAEKSMYLIPEMFDLKEMEAWLKKNFDKIFTQELDLWVEDDSTWPFNRTYKMFKTFFEVTLFSTVYDLEETPIQKA